MKLRTAVLSLVGLGSLVVLLALSLLRTSGGAAEDSDRSEPVVSIDHPAAEIEAPRLASSPLDPTEFSAATRIPVPPATTRSEVHRAAIEKQAVPEQRPSLDPLDLPERTLDEITTKIDALRSAIARQSKPLLSKQFDDNLADQVSTGLTYSATAADANEISEVRMVCGEGTYRASLSRSDYPDLYAWKDGAVRLSNRLRAQE